MPTYSPIFFGGVTITYPTNCICVYFRLIDSAWSIERRTPQWTSMKSVQCAWVRVIWSIYSGKWIITDIQDQWFPKDRYQWWMFHIYPLSLSTYVLSTVGKSNNSRLQFEQHKMVAKNQQPGNGLLIETADPGNYNPPGMLCYFLATPHQRSQKWREETHLLSGYLT